MIKRPLCIVCLGVIAILLIFDVCGLSQKWKPKYYQLLSEKAEMNVACQLEGRVAYYERKPKFIYIYLKNSILTVHSEQYSIPEIIIKYSGSEGFAIGNLICIRGKLEAPEGARNPGQFDAQKFYRTRNIDYFVEGDNVKIVDDKYDWLRGGLFNLREKFCTKINLLAPQDGGVLSAMLTGDKSFLEEDVKIRYQMTSTLHIIAISGLHLSILGMGCHKLLIKMRLNHYLAGVIAVLFMMAYGILTGAGVSVMRALIMFVLYVGAKITGRTYDMFSALAMSAIMILVENPLFLYDGGFLLSFGAILGIGVVYPILSPRRRQKKSKKMSERLVRTVTKSLWSGSAIWLTTLPIILSSYYEVSLYGIIVNLIVIPSSTIVLVCGLLAGSVGFLSMFFAKILILPATCLLMIYDCLGMLVQRLPYAMLILGEPPLWKCVVYYLALMGVLILLRYICNQKRRNKSAEQREANKKEGVAMTSLNWLWKAKSFGLAIGVVLFGILSISFFQVRNSGNLQVTAIDVSQGDGLIIRTPSNKAYLVDGGSSDVKKVGKYRIMPYLKSQGIGRLEAVIISHPDADHLNGALELFESIGEYETSLRVDKCIIPKWMASHEDAAVLIEAASTAGIKMVYVSKGDKLIDGEVIFDFIYPAISDETHDEKVFDDNPNEGSLTFILEYRNFEGLFTGDLCDDGEIEVMQEVYDIDLLKVAHHGSKNSTATEFLLMAQPEISFISCSEKNSYGHPHPDLLERLEEINSEVYITKDYGAIMLTTNGWEKMMIEKFCLEKKGGGKID